MKGALACASAFQSGRIDAMTLTMQDPRLNQVAPELREAAIASLHESNATPPLSAANLAALRTMYDVADVDPNSPIAWERRQIPGSAGCPPVTIYIVNAKPMGTRPAILHMHGGGFILGTPLMFMSLLQSVAEELDCLIVSVDYRLAPEIAYSGSIEDNYAALKWLHANAETLGADPRRIAVMGESAGGGHAAILALTARDRGEVPIAFQCLTYPMLDDRTGSSRAVTPANGHLVWTARDNRFGWESFLGMEPGTSLVPAWPVPIRADNLQGLPPCFVAVGSVDLFMDENIAYARRLAAAGVSTELHVIAGAFHGFDMYPEAQGTSLVERMRAVRLSALKAGLAIPLMI